MTNSQFRMSAAEAEQPPVVTATGDIDLANVNEFQEVLDSAAANSDAITVDLSDVTYCDSAAVRALFAVAATTKLGTDRARDGAHHDAAEYLRPRPRRDRGDPRLNMAPPYFQPRQHPQLVALMNRILERMQSDLLDALGMAITVHDKAMTSSHRCSPRSALALTSPLPSCRASVARFPMRSLTRCRC